MRNAVDRTSVPVQPRHGYIRMRRAVSASSKEISRKQCAVRWQMTKASIVSALRSRSQLRQFDQVRLPNIIAFAARFPPYLDRYRSRSRKIPRRKSHADATVLVKAIIVDPGAAAEFAPQRPRIRVFAANP